MEHVHPAHSPLALRGDNAPPLILFDELALEILSWLPVKSLIRFKCVCKDWRSFISNPNFKKEHLQKSPKNSDLMLTSRGFGGKKFAHSCSVRSLLKNPSSTIITEDLSYCLVLERDYRIVGSCNGLVCLVGKYFRVKCKEIFVHFWNPATMLISEKPMCLSFDWTRHSTTHSSFGFGYDNLNDTYKVVVVLYELLSKENSEVKMYSLDDNCGRNIQNFPFSGRVVHDNGVYVNGTLNWLEFAHFNSNQSGSLIVSLDLGKETCTQLLPPCGLEEVACTHRILGVLMDCLCLSHDYKRTHFVVWQMKELGVQKSWTPLLNVSYLDIPIDFLQFTSLSPLHMYKNGDILIMMSSCGHLQAILYNPRDNRVEPIETTNNITWIGAMDYVQSLVSPSSNYVSYDKLLI